MKATFILKYVEGVCVHVCVCVSEYVHVCMRACVCDFIFVYYRICSAQGCMHIQLLLNVVLLVYV